MFEARGNINNVQVITACSAWCLIFYYCSISTMDSLSLITCDAAVEIGMSAV